jgi:DNA-binding transcriptional regulator YbjK
MVDSEITNSTAADLLYRHVMLARNITQLERLLKEHKQEQSKIWSELIQVRNMRTGHFMINGMQAYVTLSAGRISVELPKFKEPPASVKAATEG